MTVVEPGYDVTVKELERGDNYSILEMKGAVPTVTAGGVVLFRAIYDIAKERGFEYTFSAPSRQGTAKRGPEGRQVFTVVKVFMMKDDKTALKELLGDDYSKEAQEMFDRNGYMSASLLAPLFGGISSSTIEPGSTFQFDTPEQPGTAKELIGQWRIVSGEFSGQPIPSARLPESLIQFDIDGRWSGLEGDAATWSVDSTKSPKTLDLKYTAGRDQGKKQLCIYRISEGRLAIVFGIPGGKVEDRPDGFTTKDKPNTVMLIFERADHSTDK